MKGGLCSGALRKDPRSPQASAGHAHLPVVADPTHADPLAVHPAVNIPIWGGGGCVLKACRLLGWQLFFKRLVCLKQKEAQEVE